MWFRSSGLSVDICEHTGLCSTNIYWDIDFYLLIGWWWCPFTQEIRMEKPVRTGLITSSDLWFTIRGGNHICLLQTLRAGQFHKGLETQWCSVTNNRTTHAPTITWKLPSVTISSSIGAICRKRLCSGVYWQAFAEGWRAQLAPKKWNKSCVMTQKAAREARAWWGGAVVMIVMGQIIRARRARWHVDGRLTEWERTRDKRRQWQKTKDYKLRCWRCVCFCVCVTQEPGGKCTFWYEGTESKCFSEGVKSIFHKQNTVHLATCPAPLSCTAWSVILFTEGSGERGREGMKDGKF